MYNHLTLTWFCEGCIGPLFSCQIFDSLSAFLLQFLLLFNLIVTHLRIMKSQAKGACYSCQNYARVFWTIFIASTGWLWSQCISWKYDRYVTTELDVNSKNGFLESSIYSDVDGMHWNSGLPLDVFQIRRKKSSLWRNYEKHELR